MYLLCPAAPRIRAPRQKILARQMAVPLLVKAVGWRRRPRLKKSSGSKTCRPCWTWPRPRPGRHSADPRIYLEQYIDRGRHVEVQVLGDGQGLVIQLGERDCSVQRRYQKLIEEGPAPNLSASLRATLQQAAVRFAARLKFRGAGTVEFMIDTQRQAFYFLEMNARIQVEHPVTEAVTGIDLIAEQIAIADGAGLRLRQSEIRTSGCAIECRVNAEDFRNDFRPSPGRVREVSWPQGEGIRVDTHVVPGSSIPPFYDSLMGKIIAWAEDRPTALARLRRAIAATRISGVKSNLGFHAAALEDGEFQIGGVDTGFVDRLYARRPGLSDGAPAGADNV